MKNSWIVVILLLVGLGYLSCSKMEETTKDLEQNAPPKIDSLYLKQKEEANLRLAHYLALEGERYVLNISQSEAERLGVSTKCYNAILEDIATVNATLKELRRNDPKKTLELTDPKTTLDSLPLEFQIKDSKGVDTFPVEPNSAPRGLLNTDGQEEATDRYLWAPSSIKGITFVCRPKVAQIAVHTCKTYSSGTWRYETGTSFF